MIAGGKEFQVHKAILSVNSPVFAAMFDHSDTKEAREGKVEIPDVAVEVAEELLRYIYTGQIPTMAENALELFMVADKVCYKNYLVCNYI